MRDVVVGTRAKRIDGVVVRPRPLRVIGAKRALLRGRQRRAVAVENLLFVDDLDRPAARDYSQNSIRIQQPHCME